MKHIARYVKNILIESFNECMYIIACAYHWLDLIENGKYANGQVLAKASGLTLPKFIAFCGSPCFVLISSKISSTTGSRKVCPSKNSGRFQKCGKSKINCF